MMDESEIFAWPYPSPLAALAVVSVAFIVGGCVVIRMLPWLGVLLILAGIGVIVPGCIAETRYSIVCMSDGFTVSVKRRLGKERHTAYAWQDVTETGYREAVHDAYFAAYTARGRAFEIRRTSISNFVRAKFDAMIQIFNGKTPQLPYIWQWQGPGSSRLWRYGFYRYRKVPREIAMSRNALSEIAGSE